MPASQLAAIGQGVTANGARVATQRQHIPWRGLLEDLLQALRDAASQRSQPSPWVLTQAVSLLFEHPHAHVLEKAMVLRQALAHVVDGHPVNSKSTAPVILTL